MKNNQARCNSCGSVINGTINGNKVHFSHCGNKWTKNLQNQNTKIIVKKENNINEKKGDRPSLDRKVGNTKIFFCKNICKRQTQHIFCHNTNSILGIFKLKDDYYYICTSCRDSKSKIFLEE